MFMNAIQIETAASDYLTKPADKAWAVAKIVTALIEADQLDLLNDLLLPRIKLKVFTLAWTASPDDEELQHTEHMMANLSSLAQKDKLKVSITSLRNVTHYIQTLKRFRGLQNAKLTPKVYEDVANCLLEMKRGFYSEEEQERWLLRYQSWKRVNKGKKKLMQIIVMKGVES